jgi:hypothetical protein
LIIHASEVNKEANMKYCFLLKFIRILSGIIIMTGLVWVPKQVSAVGLVYASPDGTPANACTIDDPCDIQTAVDTVDAGGMVYAEQGIYYAYGGTGNQVLYVNRDVGISGGWNGSSADPVIDPDVYVSILDGQNIRRVVHAASFPVAGMSGISGFTIRNGNGSDTTRCPHTNAAGCGGGILIDSVPFSVAHCIIENNVAATTTSTADPLGYGGGLYIHDPVSMTITHNIIRYNTASTVTSGTTAYPGMGGGIFVSGGTDVEGLDIRFNEIYGNNATTPSYSGSGAGLAFENSSVYLRDNYIHDNDPNMSSYGSAIYAISSEISIFDNRILDNMGTDIIYLNDYNGKMLKNVIINPESFYGVRLSVNSDERYSTLANNIIAKHFTGNILISGSSADPANVKLYHNTLDGSENGIYMIENATVTVSNSIISNNAWALYKNPTGTNMVASNAQTLFHDNDNMGPWDLILYDLSGDPLYEDAAGGDYHIQAESAARDRAPSAGYVNDIDNDRRPCGSGPTPYDVGADEFWWKSYLPILQKP